MSDKFGVWQDDAGMDSNGEEADDGTRRSRRTCLIIFFVLCLNFFPREMEMLSARRARRTCLMNFFVLCLNFFFS